jgi:two-component system, OmpR family, sensor histidine kinase SenX3
MRVAPGRRGAIAFFVTFGVCLVSLAVALNIGWVVLTWSQVGPLLLGVTIFAAIIAGLILNTTFLVREFRRNEQHDAFVNAVTHELKTPVTSIRLHLETLLSRSGQLDDATRHEFYGVMLDDSARLLQTIDQVLRAGQVSRAPLHKVPLDLRSLVERSVALVRTRLHLPVEALRLEPALPGAELIDIEGDEQELSSAVMNLLDNAVKYSADRVDVEVAVAIDGPRARVSVRDHGAGLSSAEVKRIFRRFYRAPGALNRRVKGTGLGLFIVRTVARRHGGRAYATSAGAGQGSTFVLELPVVQTAGRVSQDVVAARR